MAQVSKLVVSLDPEPETGCANCDAGLSARVDWEVVDDGRFGSVFWEGRLETGTPRC